jgi:hypothetical protein
MQYGRPTTAWRATKGRVAGDLLMVVATRDVSNCAEWPARAALSNPSSNLRVKSHQQLGERIADRWLCLSSSQTRKYLCAPDRCSS